MIESMQLTPTPTLPYWLQVTAVVAAPILGVLGVMFGTWLTSVRERHGWLRAERLVLYTDFLKEAQSLSALLGTQGRTALRLHDDEAMVAVLAKVMPRLERLMASMVQFDLLAPRHMSTAAVRVSTALGATSILFLHVFHEEEDFNAVAWDRTIVSDMDVINIFAFYAARDIGVPRRDIRKKRKKPALTDEDYRRTQEWILTAVDGALRQEQHQEDRSHTDGTAGSS